MTEKKLREVGLPAIEREILDFIEGVLAGPSDFLPNHVVKDLVDTAMSCFRHLLNGDTEAADSDRKNFYLKNGRYL